MIPIDRANLIAIVEAVIIAILLAMVIHWPHKARPQARAISTDNPCPADGPNCCVASYDGHKWHTVVIKDKGCN